MSVLPLGLNRAQHHWLDQGADCDIRTDSSGTSLQVTKLNCWTGSAWSISQKQWIMGCSASVVLLLRSVGGADCGHMCSRQDQMSLDAATPTLEGYTATASPLTIIVMVISISSSPLNFYLMHVWAGRVHYSVWAWSTCVHIQM